MRRLRLGLALAVLAAVLSSGLNAAAVPSRVLALGGDITETVYALQAQASLVGVDSTSTWPLAAKALPDVGYVRQLAAEGILALHPQLIMATHDAGPPAVIQQLREAGIALLILPASRRPEDVVAKVRQVGQQLGRDSAAAQLSQQLTEQYQHLTLQVQAMHQHPKVLFLMSAGPAGTLAAGHGTAADAAIQLAGGRNAVDGFDGYKPVSAEALAGLAPEAIIVMRERADTAGSDAVLGLPGIAATPAGRRHQLIVIDGQALLGFGPRNAASELQLQGQLAALQP